MKNPAKSKWDTLQKTLRFDKQEFNKAFQDATSGDESGPSDASQEHAVPTGRTTLKLGKKGARIVPPKQEDSPPSQPHALDKQAPVTSPTPSPGSIQTPPVPNSKQPDLSPSPSQTEQPQSVPDSSLEQPPNIDTSSMPDISEEQAALKVQVQARSSAPKQPVVREDSDPDQFNFRTTAGIKRMFMEKCTHEGKTASKVLNSFLRTFLGMCLVFAFLFPCPSASAEANTKYTTDQIVSFVMAKGGFGFSSLLPPVKASLSGRHALWENTPTAITDSVVIVEPNTRLDLKLDVPIFDLSHYRSNAKSKREARTAILNMLSDILAYSKTLEALQQRTNLLSARLNNIKNQVKLKLANTKDIYPVEDEYTNALVSLYDAQNKLDKEIVNLSMIAGDSWQEAYQMIKGWDGKLFND